MEKFKFIRLTRNLTLTVIVALTFSLNSCKKCNDPCNLDCDNYDPCCGQTAADASFTIFEVLNAPNPTVEREGYTVTPMATDTILRFNSALMKADFEADYYEWTIGDDPRTWNTREVILNFGVQFYMPIPITLKVAKAVDKSCFPNAKDTVTFQRTLVVVPSSTSKVLGGRYEGVLSSSPTKPNFLEIKDSLDRYDKRLYSFSGILPTCNMPYQGADFSLGYNSFFIYSRGTVLGCCYGLSGYGKLESNNRFTMKMASYPFNPVDACNWLAEDGPYVVDNFTGIKTN
jgi:hypothetical protein